MADRYRLGDLAALVEIAPRTIRYYIAEGLLPPPSGAGPAAVYSPAHRDRLRLIAQLKEANLSLRDIRERLAALSDDEVRAALRQATGEAAGGTDDGAIGAEMGLPPGEQWERIVLGEGIELHIRADRRREWAILDAVIRQARRLLDEDN